MEMANYILSILRSQLMVVFSWGFNTPRAIENGLQFRVQGFLFKGVVKVVYDEGADTFIVRLEKYDGSLWMEQDDVYFDNLVDVIDGMVERTPDYAGRVAKEYGFKEE